MSDEDHPDDPPPIEVTASVPGELVTWARRDYNLKIEHAPAGHSIHETDFADYLRDVALDAVRIDLQWPTTAGPDHVEP